MPSVDAAADTTLALTTIDESLNTGQRDPRSMATSALARAQKDLGTSARFSRRLQLDPGLEPPTSWSLSPCTGPEIHWRAESLKSPDLDAIYPMPRGSARNLAVYAGSQDLHTDVCTSLLACPLPCRIVSSSNQLWTSATTTCSSLPKLIAAKSIRRSRLRLQPGRKPASSIGG